MLGESLSHEPVRRGVGVQLVGERESGGVGLAVQLALGERRAYAALGAVGFSTGALLSALRWEALMATLPVAVLGALIGSGGFLLLADDEGPWLQWSVLALAGTALAAVASTFVAAALVSPVVRSAVTTGSLRTE